MPGWAIALLAVAGGIVFFVVLMVVGLAIAGDDTGSNDAGIPDLDDIELPGRSFPYTAPDGTWSAEFPTEPEAETLSPEETGGLDGFAVSARQGRFGLREVVTFETGGGILDPVAGYDAGVDEIVRANDGTLLHQEDTTFGLLPARDFAIAYTDTNTDEGVVIAGRMFLTADRLYTISVTLPREDTAAFDEFVGSFQLLG